MTLFETVCSRYAPIPYLVDNYKKTVSRNGNVIAFAIKPSPQLISLRNDLVKALSEHFPSKQPWDHVGKEHWFHISIGWNFSDRDVVRLENFLSQKEVIPYLQLVGLRVTILGRGGRIDREYDLIRKKLLTRDQALDPHEWCKSLTGYREQKGMELTRKPLSSLWRGPQTFFISDLPKYNAHTVLMKSYEEEKKSWFK